MIADPQTYNEDDFINELLCVMNDTYSELAEVYMV